MDRRAFATVSASASSSGVLLRVDDQKFFISIVAFAVPVTSNNVSVLTPTGGLAPPARETLFTHSHALVAKTGAMIILTLAVGLLFAAVALPIALILGGARFARRRDGFAAAAPVIQTVSVFGLIFGALLIPIGLPVGTAESYLLTSGACVLCGLCSWAFMATRNRLVRHRTSPLRRHSETICVARPVGRPISRESSGSGPTCIERAP